MTVQVEYELFNPRANKQPYKQYLSAAPNRMFRRDDTNSAFGNDYIDSLRILTDRIRKFNVKFIRDKYGLRLARVLQFTFKIVKYAFLEGRGWQPLTEFLAKKKTIINIQNYDERCFGYALLYFLEQINLPDKMAIVFERLSTKNKCLNANILTLCLTPSRQTMSICMRISS